MSATRDHTTYVGLAVHGALVLHAAPPRGVHGRQRAAGDASADVHLQLPVFFTMSGNDRRQVWHVPASAGWAPRQRRV
jgi:hypothetical protein